LTVERLEEIAMAFVRLALFPDATREHYDCLARAMSHAPIPAERLLFAAGPVEGGWQVVQVWTSKAHLDDFNRAVFFPALAALGGSPFPAPPVVTDFEPVDVSLA
jgi:hypothetical protein